MQFKQICPGLMLTLFVFSVQANNLQISNVTYDIGDNSLNFDLSWDNGFYIDNTLSDHIYIFVKYKNSNSNQWKTMPFEAGGHTDDNSQMLIGINSNSNSINGQRIAMRAYHDTNFSFGSTSANCTIQLSDSISLIDPSFKIFGIEMVKTSNTNVSDYYLGDGTSANRFHKGDDASEPYFHDGSSLFVNVDVGNGPDEINTTGPGGFGVTEIPTSYFKYQLNVMRYEITQAQYVDFLNCLSRVAQNEHTETDISGTSVTDTYVMSGTSSISNRNGIRCDATLPNGGPITFFCDYNGNGIPNQAGDGQNISANFLLPKDLLAYLDWAGLIPMNEAQYEWYCRGPELPVPGEYAWGTTVKTQVNFLNFATTGTASEGPANAGSDGLYEISASPMRTGACAGSATSRVQAGSSYHGVMDLTGNVAELVIGSYSADDFAPYGTFGISEGDGTLGINGNHNEDWPANLTFKGQATVGLVNTVSKRTDPNPYVSNTVRNSKFGGRGIY